MRRSMRQFIVIYEIFDKEKPGPAKNIFIGDGVEVGNKQGWSRAMLAERIGVVGALTLRRVIRGEPLSGDAFPGGQVCDL